jgi:hypothetical protein
MLEEKVMKTLRRLPVSQQQEALDFMEYLAQKSSQTARVETEAPPSAAATADAPAAEMANAFAAIARFLTLDEAQLPAAQRQAYAQAYERLKQGRSADEPRVLGLFDGLGQISDDFDAPLPDEDLFWGGASDSNGISKEL